NGSDDVTIVTTVVVAKSILRQRFAQALEHTVVVHDHTAVLARIDTVGTGNGLHKRVRLHRLIDVESREALHVEAGEPHGADNGNAERVLWVLESVLHSHPLAIRRLEALLHHYAVRDDIKAPLLEVTHLVLGLTDDNLDDGALHPLHL